MKQSSCVRTTGQAVSGSFQIMHAGKATPTRGRFLICPREKISCAIYGDASSLCLSLYSAAPVFPLPSMFFHLKWPDPRYTTIWSRNIYLHSQMELRTTACGRSSGLNRRGAASMCSPHYPNGTSNFRFQCVSKPWALYTHPMTVSIVPYIIDRRLYVIVYQLKNNTS